MALKLFNTLSRKKEVFEPIDENKVGMYCCGPTVYNYAHIGNLRTYIFEDFLRRILDYNEFEVNHVMNITDVGHLTSDEDEGEDKMEKGAKREGKSVMEIAQFYTDAFFSDLKDLNIIEPHIKCKATEHIKEMINVIKNLESNGYTYVANGNVYYDVSRFTYYQDLGRLNLDELQSTDRVSEDLGKKHKADFVLWFTQSKFENHAMKWESPWGEGYPGWHIECTAMSSKYLGEQFDIHCGGIDHVQVHHTNEIAQAEGAFGKHPWVKYWVHGEFLIISDGKMAKSGDNFITLATLKEKDYDPLVYRYFCMGTHYRQALKFSWDALDNAKVAFNSLQRKVVSLTAEVGKTPDPSKLQELEIKKPDQMIEFEKKFLGAINDDINIPQALAILHEVLKSELEPSEKLILVYDFDNIFGLDLKNAKDKTIAIEELDDFKELVQERENARKNKDWATADRIRDELLAKGYAIKDTPNGPVVEKA